MDESHVDPLTVRESTLVAAPPDVTVSTVEPDIPLPEVAVMVVVPAATAVAFPLEAIVATVGAEELHVTDAVIFSLELSGKVPVAVNSSFVPTEMLEFAGVTVIDTSVPSA